MTTDVTVIILTFNEEKNLPFAVQSVKGWARQVLVLDSYSTDGTVALAHELGCTVIQQRFENFGRQRNVALQSPEVESEWILFLDADEWLGAELRAEITDRLSKSPSENGFLIARRFLWMGKWIRRGYYPSWILRLVRRGKAKCEDRGVNEHLLVDGGVSRLRSDFMHEDHNGLRRWIDKHIAYARKEALEQLRQKEPGKIPAHFFGEQAERARWLRHHVWNRMPPLVRPFIYFGYRYGLRGGFLDGKEALAYHVLQGLMFPLLIDAHLIALKWKRATSSEKPQ